MLSGPFFTLDTSKRLEYACQRLDHQPIPEVEVQSLLPPTRSTRPNLELRDRLLAPIAVRDAEGNVVGANLGALVRRLILFEQVVIDSYAMRELPPLINAIGPDSFVNLLESRALLIRADGWVIGETGSGGLVPGWGSSPLPHLHYSLSPLVPHDTEAHVKLCLGEIRDMELGKRTSQSVRRAIVDALLYFPENAGTETLEAMPHDLTRNLNLVYSATAAALAKRLDRTVGDDAFAIRITQVDENVFGAETNIADQFDLTDEETDTVVQDALLAIGGLNQRIEEMKGYRSIIGFRETELGLVQEKLSFLMRELDPDAQEERFERIITLAGLPNPETAAGSVDIEKLLKARDSEELREFRHWLRTLDEATDKEIEERVASVRAKLSSAVHSSAGKTIRFLTGTGVGAVNPIAGIAVGVADQFLVERLFPEPGPLSFIGSTYRSLFE